MNLQLCPLKLFYIVYNASRLRHIVPDKTCLSYITYRRLIKKHRHTRRLKRILHGDDVDERQKDRTVPAVRSESTVVSDEHRDLSCPVAEDTVAAAATPVASSSSSSVRDTTTANSCTAVVSRSSFSIMRLLSLSEDNSSGDDAQTGPDADIRKLSESSSSAAGRAAAENVASQNRSAAAGGLKDSGASVACAEGKAVPVHFKKRILSTATVTHPPSTGTSSEPAVVGKSATPRRSFTIHQDAAASTPPAKVGIVISHGRAMTLQDKLQMTTNAVRRSPSSGDRSLSAASPLRILNRHATTHAASRHKLKRRSKPVARRSLISSPKVRRFILCYSN